MNADIEAFLQGTGPVLCVDIGNGTQDALLARPGLPCENWPRLVLPAPARDVARRIRDLALQRRNVWLFGGNMGGGCSRAVLEHVEAGLAVAATASAGQALHDDPAVVRAMGVALAERCPDGSVPVRLGDFSAEAWTLRLGQLGLPRPNLLLAAAQDHGLHGQRNREGRMRLWERLLARTDAPECWIYVDVPPVLTRLAQLQADTGGPVADTGTAVLLGALSEPSIRERCDREGITVLNAGNGHTVAALLFKGRVRALYEHHTGMREPGKVLEDLAALRRGTLDGDEVRCTGGHGAVHAGDFSPGEFPDRGTGEDSGTWILGPRREAYRGAGMFAAPHGDMMLAGCLGLLWGWAARQRADPAAVATADIFDGTEPATTGGGS
ncbi:MAG: DUF1786 domain-containing protein [Desulfovibrio sp.]|jgi:uncharacterized protein (DUF1786 family)|nr:DUF1786 domain-containing protein [Desulfovibrio sp.]